MKLRESDKTFKPLLVENPEALCCTVYGFWANERPELCNLYFAGHEKILIDHGLEKLISTDNYWADRNDVFVVVAVNSEGTPIGGIRLESKFESELLPFERVLKPFEPNITDLLDSFPFKTIYEACGLWTARIAAGNDLGIFLCRVCVAIAPSLNIEAILSLNGVYTYKLPQDMGSRMVTNIGENGLFKYPIERFHSALWIQDDLRLLSRASADCKKRVQSLRNSNCQIAFEPNSKNGIIINYELCT